mgnify:CR=1 FL=1
MAAHALAVHAVESLLRVYPVSHNAHSEAPSVVQSAPVSGVPLGHTHVLAAVHWMVLNWPSAPHVAVPLSQVAPGLAGVGGGGGMHGGASQTSALAQQIEGGEAEFVVADAASPTIVRDASDASALYVLMPMRV